ncbi:MAG: hypothetical protein N2378_05535 [Chloroflexaceae bacterium]|nr:hypothetical protein [Chloroflexaceae bacterium]
MPLRFLLLPLLAITALCPSATPVGGQPALQPAAPICFPNVPGIADCIDPLFADFWRANGGLPVFGYPIGPVEQRTLEDGTTITIQWLERVRLEYHPRNPPAYRVQLGRIGVERLAQQGRDWRAAPRESGPQPGCLWFPETGYNVCDQARNAGFKTYWERNGLRIRGLGPYQRSLALFGLPLTRANPEPGPNGELVINQWFERARFEWHPEQPQPSRVLLGLLGTEARAVAPVQPKRPIFGVQISRGAVGASIGALAGVGGGMVRFDMLEWNLIEPRRGERNWQALAGPEAELAAISAGGGVPMVIIRGAPPWAQAAPRKACGPIRGDALGAFADFVGEAVRRYSGPPYNVRYWEFGNEPDAPFQLMSGDAVFGCWGDESDPLYGGAAYAEMLKAVYPAVKAANPEAQVVVGGLLLDCDPGGPSPCTAGRFLEGILAGGGGAAFDILAYHSYTYWQPVTRDWDLFAPKWSHRGGVLPGKTAFLRETMRRYGVDKPLLMNEGALLCYRNDPNCAPQGFEEAKANYAVRLFARAHQLELYGALWYTLDGPGWQESGLLDANQQPRPVYATLAFLQRTLGGAVYAGVTRDGALEIHRFRKGDVLYEIAWTNDGSTRELPLPIGARARYTLAGAAQPTGEKLVIGFEPVIVEIRLS